MMYVVNEQLGAGDEVHKAEKKSEEVVLYVCVFFNIFKRFFAMEGASISTSCHFPFFKNFDTRLKCVYVVIKMLST